MVVCADVEQGLATEVRLTGARSVVPRQAEQPKHKSAAQETGNDEEEVTPSLSSCQAYALAVLHQLSG